MTIRFPLSLPILFLAASCAHLPPPALPKALSEADSNLRKRLQAPLTAALDVDNQPFEKVLLYLAEENHINLVTNWPALTAAGVENTTPITVHLRGITLGEALSTILAETHTTTPLDFRIISGALHVSTKTDLAANSSSVYIRLRYDVGDLISLPPATGTTDKSRQLAHLMDLIMNQVSPTTWHMAQYPENFLPFPKPTQPTPANRGSDTGPDQSVAWGSTSITNDAATGEGVISAFNTSLIISQTPEIQEEIGELLTQLRGK